jgi:hypothetical protein
MKERHQMYDQIFVVKNAARLHLSPRNIRNLEVLFAEPVNWKYLLEWSENQGVQQLIYFSMRQSGLIKSMPEAVCRILQKNYERNRLINTGYLAELHGLCCLADTEIVLLKGMDLMQSLYPEIQIRKVDDMDLLVPYGSAWKLWFRLKDVGYYTKQFIPAKSNVHAEIELKHLPPLYRNNFAVELHVNLFRGRCQRRFTQEAWDSRKLFPGQTRICRLSPEYSLVYLCLHCYTHGKYEDVSYKLLCDIHELLRSESAHVDWNKVLDICNRHHLQDHVLPVADCVRSIFSERISQRPKSFALNNDKPGSSVRPQSFNFLSKLKEIRSIDRWVIFMYRSFFPNIHWLKKWYGDYLPAAYLKYYRHCVRKMLRF